MAAECEINIGSRFCGVAAIGRCTTCGNAFCATHQARGPIDPNVVYVDFCVTCLAARSKAAGVHEQRHGLSFFTSGAARTELVAGNVPKVNLILVTSEWEHRRFRGGRTVETVKQVGTGWLIGTFRWEYNDGSSFGGKDVVSPGPTILRDRAETDERKMFVRVRNDALRGGYRIESGRRIASRWEDVAVAVHRLTGVD
jgi:hypothetical protein